MKAAAYGTLYCQRMTDYCASIQSTVFFRGSSSVVQRKL
jgi:hypothetical protein